MRISDWSSDVCSSDLPRPPSRGSRSLGRRRSLACPGPRLALAHARLAGVTTSKWPQTMCESSRPQPLQSRPRNVDGVGLELVGAVVESFVDRIGAEDKLAVLGVDGDVAIPRIHFSYLRPVAAADHHLPPLL